MWSTPDYRLAAYRTYRSDTPGSRTLDAWWGAQHKINEYRRSRNRGHHRALTSSTAARKSADLVESGRVGTAEWRASDPPAFSSCAIRPHCSWAPCRRTDRRRHSRRRRLAAAHAAPPDCPWLRPWAAVTHSAVLEKQKQPISVTDGWMWGWRFGSRE